MCQNNYNRKKEKKYKPLNYVEKTFLHFYKKIY